MKFDKRSEPAKLIEFTRRHVPLFINPVGRDPSFCNVMHLLCSDLNLYPFSIWSYYGCMQGLVSVSLWHGNIVFESSGNWLPDAMDQTQNLVTTFPSVEVPHGLHPAVIILA